MKRNLLWLLGLTVAAGLIVAGCGGGGDDSTSAGQSDTTASPISKEDFIAQADQICADGNKQAQQQLQQQFGNGNVTADQLPAVAKAVSDSIKNQVSQIRALGAPEGDEDTINSFLDSAEKGANEMAQ